MARTGVSERPPDGSVNGLIDDYLDEVSGELVGPAPARDDILAELRDGIFAAVQDRLRQVPDPVEAARRVVGEFGRPSVVAAGFATELAARQARRVGLGLVVSGPIVGGIWLVTLGARPDALLAGHLRDGWAVAPLFTLVLAIVVPAAILAVVAIGRLERWMPGLPRVAPTAAALGSAGCVVGDLVLLTMFAASITAVSTSSRWPVLVAVAPLASVVRLAVAGRGLRQCLAVRAQLS